jgi:hypothetical protein
VTEASDNSIAIGAAPAETGSPSNSWLGCMRIMTPSACKRDASETRVWNQQDSKTRQNQRIPFVQSGRQTACN